jgi:hypothetical protein
MAPAAGGAACAPPPARIWQLTPRQYDNTVRALVAQAPSARHALEDLLPLSTRRFRNEAGHKDMSLAYVTQLADHAGAVAAAAAETPEGLAPCLANGVSDVACLTTVFQGLLERAYRRPASSAEVTAMVEYVRARAALGKAALADALAAVLTSASLLYRTELGAPDAPGPTFELDAFEKASALSYFLLDGPPDEPLWAAAKVGALDRAALASHARRLLATGASAGLLRFWNEYTETVDMAAVGKDEKLFPQWGLALAEDMEHEVGAFGAQVVREGGTFEALLGASHSVLSPRLAKLYGVTVAGSSDWVKTPLPPTERAGLLTQAAFLTAHGRADHGDPVMRGRFIRERLLCSTVAAPPMEVPPLPSGASAKARTMRERLAEHNSNPACSACHRLMDPLGLPLEQYDAIGQLRRDEGGAPIDPTGTLFGFGEPVPLDNAVHMAKVLAKHPQAQSCFVQSAFHYAYGRAPGEDDACELRRLDERFVASGGNLAQLIEDLVTSPHFSQRRRTP